MQDMLRKTGEPPAAPSGHPAKPRKPNRYYGGPPSDHFDGTLFFNPGFHWTRTFFQAMRAMAVAKGTRWPKHFPSPFRDRPPARVEGSGLRVALVGHATLLIQTGGLNILTDPVWSKRASPTRFAGPRRANPPGIAFDDLPQIDVVLITHNHYDHLDLATLARLNAAHKPRIIVPLGNDTIIQAHDRSIAAEAHDWSSRIVLSDTVAVHLEPALHWSARGLKDRRMALWCAFVIATPAGVIYHVGDTGFGDGSQFRTVREKFGRLRLALLPIGAYEPRWFMRDQHMNPDEAAQAFLALGATAAIGHHWGTFRLTIEGVDEPPEELAVALARHGVAADCFRALRPGEVWTATAISDRQQSSDERS
jgi:L-ascorbate metabolism protein UlaG (beta-lactamase superfamily)